MYNQRNYYTNPNARIYLQSPYTAYNNMHPNVYYQQLPIPYPPRQQVPPQKIKPIDGILIVREYEPQKGDPVVIEAAVFKGEVVQAGDKQQEVINENEAMMVGEGYASEDGKHWKNVAQIRMNVFKLGQLQIKNITKVKARYQNSLAEYKVIKISCTDKDYYLAFKLKECNQWFLKLVWAKLLIEKRQCDEYGNWTAKIEGKIYKRSKLMGDWEPKFVTIDSKSLKASKESSAGGVVNLQISHTKQIWTRFQEIRGGYYLVIKLWNGILKQQFAVPTILCLNWLYHFLGLLSVK